MAICKANSSSFDTPKSFNNIRISSVEPPSNNFKKTFKDSGSVGFDSASVKAFR